jgi:hypothetical protein
MDPQAALDSLREFFEECKNYDGKVSPHDVLDAVDAFDGLDLWMQNGGFPPRDWTATNKQSLKVEREG